MKVVLQAVLLAPLLCGAPVMSAPAPDLGFLKEQPFRKSKQAIDTSSITTDHDARVIKEAITPVMRLMVALSYANLPPTVDRDVLTEQGRRALRQPPLRNDKKRLSVNHMGNWKVCGENTLSFSAVYVDLFRKNPWQANFLFVKEDGAWRFHDHAEVKAAPECR